MGTRSRRKAAEEADEDVSMKQHSPGDTEEEKNDHSEQHKSDAETGRGADEEEEEDVDMADSAASQGQSEQEEQERDEEEEDAKRTHFVNFATGETNIADNHVDSSSPDAMLRSMWQFAGIAFLVHDASDVLRLPRLSAYQIERLLIDPMAAHDALSMEEFVNSTAKKLWVPETSLSERCRQVFAYLSQRALDGGYANRMDPIGQAHDGWVYYYLGDGVIRLCRESWEDRRWETVATDAYELESFLDSGILSDRRKADRPLLEVIREDLLPYWRTQQKRIEKQRAIEMMPRKRSSRILELEEQKKRQEEEALRRQIEEMEEQTRRQKEREKDMMAAMQARGMAGGAGAGSGVGAGDAEGDGAMPGESSAAAMDRMERRRLEREARRAAFEEKKLVVMYANAKKDLEQWEAELDREFLRERWLLVWQMRKENPDQDVFPPDDLPEEEYVEGEYEDPPEEYRQALKIVVPNWPKRKHELKERLRELRLQQEEARLRELTAMAPRERKRPAVPTPAPATTATPHTPTARTPSKPTISEEERARQLAAQEEAKAAKLAKIEQRRQEQEAKMQARLQKEKERAEKAEEKERKRLEKEQKQKEREEKLAQKLAHSSQAAAAQAGEAGASSVAASATKFKSPNVMLGPRAIGVRLQFDSESDSIHVTLFKKERKPREKKDEKDEKDEKGDVTMDEISQPDFGGPKRDNEGPKEKPPKAKKPKTEHSVPSSSSIITPTTASSPSAMHYAALLSQGASMPSVGYQYSMMPPMFHPQMNGAPFATMVPPTMPAPPVRPAPVQAFPRPPQQP